MKPSPPEIPADRRAAGLQASLQLRRERAVLKAHLADLGPRYLIEQVWDWDEPVVQGMKVRDLLTALPGIGAARANALLEAAGIPARNTVRACGPKQRERLFALLQD